MALYLRYAVRSDLGLVRGNNEDSVYAGPRLLAIADGMGGHAAGEVASKIVISAMGHLDEDRRIDDLMGALRDTVQLANRGIADAVSDNAELEGMGTTLTALRFVGSKIGMVHVGDSRAYLLRNDELTQITHDDTYVQYLVDTGKLTPDEAKDHPRKSVILRALLGTDVDPDVSIREAHAGDRYMLCSDGLSDVVSSETIAEAMRIEDPQESADRLVELALRGGGPDNVTVIVADVINAKVGDRIDDVPVIAGAFVDPAAADHPVQPAPGADSAAERAAQMSRQSAATPVEDVPPAEPIAHRRRWRWKPWLLILSLVAVVAIVLGAIYVWTQNQYFVGENNNEVAIFQGVDTRIGPVKLFSVYQRTGIKLDQLDSSSQSRVKGGITADSKSDAKRIVSRLRARQPVTACPSGSSTPTPAPTSPSVNVPPPQPSSSAASVTNRSLPVGVSSSTAGDTGERAGGGSNGEGGRGGLASSTAPVAGTSSSVTSGSGSSSVTSSVVSSAGNGTAPAPVPATPCRSGS